jgi:cytochrome b subunit of formate dehydrogenase
VNPNEPPTARPDNSGEKRYYIRFTLAERYLHGVLAGTFLGLAATGLPLRFSSASWALAFTDAVGGFGAILFFHKFCAVVLTIAFLLHVGDIAYRVVAKKEYGLLWGPSSMVPRWKDVQDFIGNIKWFLRLGPRPRFDRYGYWEKVDYWAVFWGMAIIGFSGYSMWFAPFFAKFLPGRWFNIALLVHGEEALLAVGFIFTIHFFNGHLRPGSFPMDLTIFTGRQTERELRERHPQEYARLTEEEKLETIRTNPPPRWLTNFSRLLGVTAIVIGFVLVAFTIVAFFRL